MAGQVLLKLMGIGRPLRPEIILRQFADTGNHFSQLQYQADIFLPAASEERQN
jgi:hypothetical protein